MKTAVIGLGGNVGDRLLNLKSALTALRLVPGVELKRVSSVYETAPWGFTAQRSFYNMAAEVLTFLPPEGLLGACLGIEAALGRERLFKNGPRTVDLDLLLYEGETRETAFLTLPHPHIAERDFVLAPLYELFPSFDVLGFCFEEAYRALPTEKAPCKLPITELFGLASPLTTE